MPYDWGLLHTVLGLCVRQYVRQTAYKSPIWVFSLYIYSADGSSAVGVLMYRSTVYVGGFRWVDRWVKQVTGGVGSYTPLARLGDPSWVCEVRTGFYTLSIARLPVCLPFPIYD